MDILIATTNQGKLREYRRLLADADVHFLSLDDVGLGELDVEETGDTFKANAELKAIAYAKASGKYALADDSGLCVSALGGAPGIYSARWAGPEKDFALALQRVQNELGDELGDKAERSAYFICALALAWPDGHVESFEGRIDGHLIWPPRGQKGFGYDPVFIPQGYSQSFGEMEPEAKHAISHRARAFAALVKGCFS
jgi:XTP/dITP diphosphohydrolase